MYIVVASSWLLAPYLDSALSPATSLISQYEAIGMPFAWLFRLGDMLAAAMLLVAIICIRSRSRRMSPRAFFALLLVAVLMALDSSAAISCKVTNGQCIELGSAVFLVHAAETMLLSFLIFGMSAYFAVKKKNIVATLFLVFQIIYGLLFIGQFTNLLQSSTITQYTYQLTVIVWLAWLIGYYTNDQSYSPKIKRYIRIAFACWAYINGLLAIYVSFTHIQPSGILQAIYFAGDTAWLAQHGVIVGFFMLFISRHLWRGEHRARQLFLVLLGLETIKYAIITPHPFLVIMHWMAFAVLFSLRPVFDRGSMKLSWHNRLQEIGIFVSGLLIAAVVILVGLSSSPRHLEIASRAFTHLNRFIDAYNGRSSQIMQSYLFAHTVTAAVVFFVLFILWSLFRPEPHTRSPANAIDINDAETLLQKYAQSSEDYFKIWPTDKQYYWQDKRQGFIAYKVSGSVVFGMANPIAEDEQGQQDLLHEFTEHWSKKGYKVCFILVAEKSKNIYQESGMKAIQIGSNAVVNVTDFANSTQKDKWWRWQTNRATRQGYAYKQSTPPHSEYFIEQLEDVSTSWMQRSGHREQGFALGSFDEKYMQQCKIHYLTDSTNEVIAFANQIPIFNNRPQTTVDLIRFRPSISNAMPYLLSNIINELREQGTYEYFDLGFVPLANQDNALAKIVRILSSGRFSAAGLEQFKNKFDPEWHKCYLVYSGDIMDLTVIGLNLEEVMKQQ